MEKGSTVVFLLHPSHSVRPKRENTTEAKDGRVEDEREEETTRKASIDLLSHASDSIALAKCTFLPARGYDDAYSSTLNADRGNL